MRCFSIPALLVTVVACSSGTKPPLTTTGPGGIPPGGGGPPTDDGGASSCSFPASPTPFALPTIAGAPAPAFSQLENSGACASGSGKLAYFLADMSSDDEPDLVVTSTCDDASVGTSVWLVYLGSGTGFASMPIRFALPPATTPAACATPAIVDVNGDFLPDYVVTSLCNDVTVGTSRWLVYLNEQTGYAQTAISYTLPPGYSAGAFAATSATTDQCTSPKNIPAFSLFDITGDAIPDFVMTEVCSNTAIGTTAWQVYAGSASGAAQTPASFALPTTPAVTTGAFASTVGALSCTASVTRPTYYLVDFEVTGKVGLVVTQECSDATVGTSNWLWYRNTGQAFAATPATIALPTIAGAPTGSFPTLSATGTCANGAGAPTYSLIDVGGKTVLDLVVTRDCNDALTGVSYWQIFPNTPGSGFTSPHLLLDLPPLLGATSAAPLGLGGALDCTAPARPAFTATYLTGVGLDLVVTGECNDSTVGNSRWLVFPASCP